MNGKITFELDGYMCCRVSALVEWVRKNRAESIVLPGGSKAVSKWLMQECPGAEHVQVKNPSTFHEGYQRVVRWPVPDEVAE